MEVPSISRALSFHPLDDPSVAQVDTVVIAYGQHRVLNFSRMSIDSKTRISHLLTLGGFSL